MCPTGRMRFSRILPTTLSQRDASLTCLMMPDDASLTCPSRCMPQHGARGDDRTKAEREHFDAMLKNMDMLFLLPCKKTSQVTSQVTNRRLVIFF
jgi:hypothetical protein